MVTKSRVQWCSAGGHTNLTALYTPLFLFQMEYAEQLTQGRGSSGGATSPLPYTTSLEVYSRQGPNSL